MMTNGLSAQEIAERARRTYQAGDLVQAAQAFEQAAAAYAGAGDALMSAEMQNNRSVALLRAKQPEAALQAVLGTDTVFAGAGDAKRQGMALANQASALQALKRSAEAIDHYNKAADALEKADEGDLRAEVMQLLSMLYLSRFKFYDAVITLQSGLSGVKNPTPRQRFMKKILFIRL
jgi:tetratricopeptide (TPR) repeat protein